MALTDTDNREGETGKEIMATDRGGVRVAFVDESTSIVEWL